MIVAGPHRAGDDAGAHVQGWLISVLLHGTMALAAILFVKQVRLAPQPEPFKWNVALVSPAQPVEPAPSAPLPAPPSAVPSMTSPPPADVQQAAPAQSGQSAMPLMQQTAPPISERIAAPVVTEPPAPTPPHPTAPSQSAVQAAQPVAVPVPKAAVPPPVVPESAPVAALPPAEPIGHEAAAPTVADPPHPSAQHEPQAVETTSIEKPAAARTAVPAESVAPATPSSVPPAILEQTAQSDAAPGPTQTAAISPAASNAPTKRDYGWLSETILRRVEELKRYPASARLDRAEGKVIVKAVIHADGSLGEVEVLRSSGYTSLDRAALELMQQAAPFQLPHPLGKSRITIQIPLSYRLER